MAATLLQRQGQAPLTANRCLQPLLLLPGRTGQCQQRAGQHHAGQQRRRRQVLALGFEDRPQAHATEIQPAEVRRKRDRAPAQLHRLAPQLAVEALRHALVTQAPLCRDRAACGQEVVGTVSQQALFVVVTQVHADTPFLPSGRPSTRLAMTLSCTSEAPPEMVRA
ncbi:hypothetical protein D9M71_515090 [compost metagenome]